MGYLCHFEGCVAAHLSKWELCHDHRGIGWGSQYCTENECRCHGYPVGEGPYMHYTNRAAPVVDIY